MTGLHIIYTLLTTLMRRFSDKRMHLLGLLHL